LSGCSKSDKIFIKKTAEGGYILVVNNKPLLVKGVIYNPTPICEGYDYVLFTDATKPWLVDGHLMKEMGVNVVRIYSCSGDLEYVKEFIRDMYENFGIYTIIGDWLGLWNTPAPNYADESFRKQTKERVLSIVETLKDEEGLLMWLLGNENNYTFSGKIAFWTSEEIENIDDAYKKVLKRAEIYYSFVDELAKEIKEIDPAHPVLLGNGEVSMLEVAAKTCPSVDALGIISYRGKRFGNLFENIRYTFDKPILISEYGSDSYDSYRTQEAEDVQSEYLSLQWEHIYQNTFFSGNKKGNCLGGTLFEWTDEWWKHNEGYFADWCIHNTEGGWSNGSYYFDIKAQDNLNMNEEWFGIINLSQEKEGGIHKRIPKKAFYTLKEMWTKPSPASR
jgi:beta-galactosidase/beta-glucuronidase